MQKILTLFLALFFVSTAATLLLGFDSPLAISSAEAQRRRLSFSPGNISFSLTQGANTAEKYATLSSRRGSPSIKLTKSANSNWLILPSPRLGALPFRVNTAGLAPGTYRATVTASSFLYTSATLQITLVVSAAPTLTFSPGSLSYSVVQNGAAANQSARLSASKGNPSVALAKSANSNWLVLPAAGLGSLVFKINAAGLAPGTYKSTVTASASSYTSATLQVTLSVTASQTLSLSFSPSSLTFSVIQNGTAANQSSTLSANTGNPAIALAKSANSNWLTLPAAGLGPLAFKVNAAGLAPGTYNATVTASAASYASATLQVTLVVAAQPVLSLSFSPASLSYSVVQNGTAAAKSSTLSASTGSPVIILTKSLNSNWLILPQGNLGSLSFAINAAGLAPGTYQSTVTASALLYTSATLQVTLVVTAAQVLSFSPANLSFSVKQSGTTTAQSSALSASTGSPAVTLTKSANSNWLVLPAAGLGSLSFNINSAGLTPGNYTSTVTASADKYSNATLGISLTVTQLQNPSVVSVNPPHNATNISENSSISTDILNLPNGGINNATITSSSVYLTENSTGTVVPSNVNGTGGGDAITLVPGSPLKFNTTYKFTITAGVKDLSGTSFVPYTSVFTTRLNSTGTPTPAKFTRVELSNTTGRHSSLKIGPDGKLYALTIDGIIKRFSINADGSLGTPELLYSLQDAYGSRKQRLAIGFAFDPSSTATNLIAWVTHSTFVFLEGPDWDGKLTKLSGSNLQTVQDALINLPRSAKDHLPNNIAFGPDGALYFTQGSNSAMGRADTVWSMREEHLLCGAVLRLDLQKLTTLPLNVKTAEGGGTYSPYLVTSPLTIYASGVRNAYDLLWHSNGQLYVPANGSAAGGNTPASVPGTRRPDGTLYSGPSVPALTKVQQTQKDFLFRIVKGGYYGHPNSLRGEYVMNGGNPTSSADPAQVSAYPVGTLPDANWRGYAFDFQNNKSPNGVIEYKSNTFNGALKGKILVVRYSQNDDIITLTPGGPNNDIIASAEGASIEGFTGFVDPLDLIEDTRNGNIYVSEYGGSGKIVLLKPVTSASSPPGP